MADWLEKIEEVVDSLDQIDEDSDKGVALEKVRQALFDLAEIESELDSQDSDCEEDI